MTYDNQYDIILLYNIGESICIKLIFIKITIGQNEVEKYIKSLQKNNNRTNRIKLNKIIAYMRMLEQYGLTLGEPYIKHISDNIWELRPLRDRILFAQYENNKFIILTIFMKQTQKTPESEIKRAKRLFRDWSDAN